MKNTYNNKNSKTTSDIVGRNFVSLAAKCRKGGAMGDRRKKRAKEKGNLFQGWEE